MHSVNRAGPHIILGALTLLGVAAIVLSLDTAPPNARQQLRTAAANTAAATSFVLTDTEIAGPASAKGASTSANEEQAVIVFQAPDRVEETVTAAGRTASVLVVGNRRYERSTNGKWYDLGTARPVSGQSEGEAAVQQVLFPFQSLSSATDVSVIHDVYRFQPGQPALLLTRLLGTSLPSGSATYAATVAGEFVRYEAVSVRASDEEITVLLALSHVESAPSISMPPSSQLTTVPPAS